MSPDAEVMAMTLVVIDVAAGERGLIQMPDERLLPERQLVEAVGIQLDDGGVVDLLEQVGPIGCLQRQVRLSDRARGSLHSIRALSLCAPSAHPARRLRRARDTSSSGRAGTCAASGRFRRHRRATTCRRSSLFSRGRARVVRRSSRAGRRPRADGRACRPPGSRRRARCFWGRAGRQTGGARLVRRSPCRSTR